METEEWKQVRGYEGFYEVSNLGRVRSVDHIRRGRNGGICQCRGKVIKTCSDKGGYQVVTLSKDGKRKVQKVHRIVLRAFMPGDEEKTVHHINHNRTDNRLCNLTWLTRSENAKDAARRRTRKKENCKYE